MKRHLELFSGTHSFGKVSSDLGFEVISLDRDLGDACPFGSGYISGNHIRADIMEWDYKQYPRNYFYLITASPVCLWWSMLKFSHINRVLKNGLLYTRETIQEDIEKYGVPMVDKVFEIIDYFNPDYYLVENPQTGQMKYYINDLIPFYDVDYSEYGYPYKKRTRLWTNIEGFKPKLSQLKKHPASIGHWKGYDRPNKKQVDNYRIPELLIKDLFNYI